MENDGKVSTLLFFDILYSVVIGLGMTYFPENPAKNYLHTLLFIWVLYMTIQDWYQSHDKHSLIKEENEYIYMFLNTGIIFTLGLIFKSLNENNLFHWLFYCGVYFFLTTYWNIYVPYVGHSKYAFRTFLVTILFWGLTILYKIYLPTNKSFEIVASIILVLLAIFRVFWVFSYNIKNNKKSNFKKKYF